jgi:hypothetical protein
MKAVPEFHKRYTYRQLNTQAKQAFRRIQLDRPEGGIKQDYRYQGWVIIINNGHVSQVLDYDVIVAEKTIKRSHAISL